MGNALVKLADDEYLEWSSIVDAPVTYIVSRAEAVAEWGETRVARADANGHSYTDMPPCSAEELVAYNRAGPNEEWLTLEAIRCRYRSAEACEAPLSDDEIATCEDCDTKHRASWPCPERETEETNHD